MFKHRGFIKNGFDGDLFKNHPIYGSFFWDMYDCTIEEHGYYRLIFSREFAKAFFGEERFMHWIEGQIDEIVEEIPEEVLAECEYGFGESWSAYQPVWEYHLREMVLEEEPLKYLEKFIKE